MRQSFHPGYGLNVFCKISSDDSEAVSEIFAGNSLNTTRINFASSQALAYCNSRDDNVQLFLWYVPHVFAWQTYRHTQFVGSVSFPHISIIMIDCALVHSFHGFPSDRNVFFSELCSSGLCSDNTVSMMASLVCDTNYAAMRLKSMHTIWCVKPRSGCIKGSGWT